MESLLFPPLSLIYKKNKRNLRRLIQVLQTTLLSGKEGIKEEKNQEDLSAVDRSPQIAYV